MDNNKLTDKILAGIDSDCMALVPSFTQTYIKKLLYNILTYVDSTAKLGKIEVTSSYSGENEISQDITGIPGARSYISGNSNSLIAFADNYSHLGIKNFDLLAKDVLLDFLNLHNGLFVVSLSKQNIADLSLDVPKQNGNYSLDSNNFKSITIIPVLFTYGKVDFLLCEL